MQVVVTQVAASASQQHRLKGETRDALSLRSLGAKLAVRLGVWLPRSTRSESLARVQLLQAFRVRLLESSLQTVGQYSSGGSRMSSFCKDVVALAQGDRTAWLEMASGLSQSSALHSLMRVLVSQVAASQHRQLAS